MQVLNKYTIETFCARTKEKYVVFASRKVCSKSLLLGKRYAQKKKKTHSDAAAGGETNGKNDHLLCKKRVDFEP